MTISYDTAFSSQIRMNLNIGFHCMIFLRAPLEIRLKSVTDNLKHLLGTLNPA